MKLLFVGDMHLADRESTNQFTLKKRIHIIDHDEFDRQLLERLNTSDADHVIFLGDVIDWYSPENILQAKKFLDQIKPPWTITPGNHDYQLDLILRPKYNQEKVHEWADENPLICKSRALQGWQKIGVTLGSQRIKIGETSIYLLDSAVDCVSEKDQNWFMAELKKDQAKHILLATHIPFPIPSLVEIIHARKSNPDGYIQTNSKPELIELILQKVDHVITGHLHFQETKIVGRTKFHLVSLATHLENDEFTSIATIELD